MGSDPHFGLVNRVAQQWVADPDSDVVYTEVLDGRIAVRVAQRTRDFTTIWFEVGDLTLATEAYVLPAPPANRDEAYRQCLFRNFDSRRVHFAIDRHGDIFLRGRTPLDRVTEDELEGILAEVYQLVEIAFRPLIRVGFTTH